MRIYQDLLPKNGLKFMINQEENCNVNKETRIKISMLRSDLCDYFDAYIVAKGITTVVRPDNPKTSKATAFKNNEQIEQKLIIQKI